MSERDDLLRGIREHPEDDAPRLVFADWLDDTFGSRIGTPAQKERDWAAAIRREVEAARIPRTDPRYWESRTWSGDIKPASRAVALMPEPFRRHARYSRGFPDGLRLGGEYRSRYLDALASFAAPVYRLELIGAWPGLASVAECPGLARIRHLRITGRHSGLQTLALARSAYLANLDSFDAQLTPDGVAAIVASPAVRRLRELSLRARFGDRSLRGLLDPAGPRLERLRLRGPIDFGHLEAVLTSPNLAGLRELTLRTGVEERTLGRLLKAGTLPHLTSLCVSSRVAEQAGFFHSECFGRLTELTCLGPTSPTAWTDVPDESDGLELSLACGPVFTAEAAALMRSPIIGRCSRLDVILRAQSLGELTTLAQSPRARRLRVLRIRCRHPYWRRPVESIPTTFADSPLLAELHELELPGGYLTEDSFRALTQATFARSLRALWLGHCAHLGERELDRLADPSVFPKLKVLCLHVGRSSKRAGLAERLAGRFGDGCLLHCWVPPT